MTAFRKISEIFGKPEIDLFATKLNAKCNKYISRFPDPDSLSTNAFTATWSNKNFLCFSPFAIISKVLDKIVLEKATGIVIVPNWPSQP